MTIELMEVPLKATQCSVTKAFDPYWIEGHRMFKLKTMKYDDSKRLTLLSVGLVIGYDSSKKLMHLFASDSIIQNLRKQLYSVL